MFFLLRCVFWLGLVFHAMDWGGVGPAVASNAVLGAVARSAVVGAVTSVGPAVRDLCLAKPGGCLALVTGASAAGRAPEAPAAGAAAAAAPEPQGAPLPPRRPRGLS